MARSGGGRTPDRRHRPDDGSMSLVEHLRELRSRVLKAAIGVVVGSAVGVYFAERLITFLAEPYCARFVNQPCAVNLGGPAAYFLLRLKVGLLVGLMVAAPVWLYQLWAFVAPGLHRHERKWAYRFVAVATPLFAAGVLLAHYAIRNALQFLLPSTSGRFAAQVDLSAYIDFITGIMLLFGAAFEFPILIYVLNLAGVVSARKLLSWWRMAVFLCFLFAAFATPTPDPFTMIALAAPMSLLYFAAVGAASLTDRRRHRKAVAAGYGDVADDEMSRLEYKIEPIDGPSPVNEEFRR
jgi:sec-independent protein translocase protein TatC